MTQRNDVNVVIIQDLGIMGIEIQSVPNMSLILYYDDGFRYEEWMENEDFTVVDVIKVEDY